MAAKWPTSIAADADLYVAVNSLQTTLATAVNNSVASIVLASATGFPTAGAVTIDNEVIFYTGISGATLTGCTRGADGTTAASHSVGVPVGASIVAFHHNGLMAEIEAIETDINARLGRGASSNSIVVPSGVSFEIDSTAGLAITATTNQLVLGTTRTVTLSAATPITISRTWTIPDLGTSPTFAALEATQTFSGSKTFSAVTTLFTANRTDTQGNCPVLLSEGQKYGFRIDTNNIFNLDAFNGATWTTPFIVTATGDVKVTGNTSPNFYVVSSSGSGVQVRILASTTSAGYIQTQSNHPLYFTTNNGVNALEITTSQTVNIRGTQTNDSAAAGFVGQYISSATAGPGITLTSGQYNDVTSITLTAGDWDISTIVDFNGTPTGGTICFSGIGTVSGNSATGLNAGDNAGQTTAMPTVNSDQSITVPCSRVSITGSTTYYLKAYAVFSGGSTKCYGRISARRVR